jgi:hypothetical protein
MNGNEEYWRKSDNNKFSKELPCKDEEETQTMTEYFTTVTKDDNRSKLFIVWWM